MESPHAFEPMGVLLPAKFFRPAPLLFALLLALTCWAHVNFWVPNHDASTYVLEAVRLLGGAQFHQDIAETNPPLIVFLTLPGVLLSDWIGVSAWAGFVIWAGALVWLAACLAEGQLARLLPDVPMGWRVAALVWALVFFPGAEFGQREHLSVCLFTPALCALSAMPAGMRSPKADAHGLLVWTLAAIGLLLKPFFLGVLAALLCLECFRQKSWRPLLGLPTVVTACVGAAYVLAIAVFCPGWFDTLSLTVQVYFGLNGSLPAVLVQFLRQMVALAIGIPLLLTLPVLRLHRRLFLNVSLAAVVWFLLAVLQRKGWAYHAQPAMCLLLLGLGSAVGVAMAADRSQMGQAWRSKVAAVALPAFTMMCMAVLCARFYLTPQYTRTHQLADPFTVTLVELAQGRPWVVWSTEVTPAFPLVLMLDGEWASRSMHQWMIPGTLKLAQKADVSPEQVSALRVTAARFATEDLARYRPLVVVVRSRSHHFIQGPFSFLEFFSVDPSFAAQWSQYRRVKSLPEWDFYVRQTRDDVQVTENRQKD